MGVLAEPQPGDGSWMSSVPTYDAATAEWCETGCMDGSDDFEDQEPPAGGTTAPATRVDATVRRVAPIPGSPARRDLSELTLMLISLKLSGAGQDVLQRYCSAALARAAQIQLANKPGAAEDLPGQLARLCAWLTGQSPADGLPREWSGMINAADRADGPRQHIEVSAALPLFNGVAVRVDSLVSGPRSWHVLLRAEPGWWTYSARRDNKRALASVHAQDDLGDMYLSQFGGSARHDGIEELTLKFLPRLNPAARALTLTFSRTPEQVTLELRLPRP
jgi:hypothetical protein